MSKIVIKYGLIGSVIAILFSVLIYVIGFNYWLNSVIQLISIVIFIFLGIYAAREFRKTNDGKISFSNAFLASFGCN